MDLDKNGVDRAGNPDFLTLDEPSPAGAFAYNTILATCKKTDAGASAGLGQLRRPRARTSSAGITDMAKKLDKAEVKEGPRAQGGADLRSR
jgi:hypothetical protein